MDTHSDPEERKIKKIIPYNYFGGQWSIYVEKQEPNIYIYIYTCPPLKTYFEFVERINENSVNTFSLHHEFCKDI